jgi:hypothetical protein
MKPRAFLLWSLLLLGATACDRASDVFSTGPPPPGAMSYKAYDEVGRLVVTGWIRLDIPVVAVAPESAAVTGDWRLHALVSPELVGLLDRDEQGELEGDFRDGQLVVALYPGSADMGCFLGGVLTVGGGPTGRMAYAGIWGDESITGPRHHGTFRATQ